MMRHREREREREREIYILAVVALFSVKVEELMQWESVDTADSDFLFECHIVM